MKKYTVFPDGSIFKYVEGDEDIIYTTLSAENPQTPCIFSNLHKARECSISILEGKIKWTQSLLPKDVE